MTHPHRVIHICRTDAFCSHRTVDELCARPGPCGRAPIEALEENTAGMSHMRYKWHGKGLCKQGYFVSVSCVEMSRGRGIVYDPATRQFWFASDFRVHQPLLDYLDRMHDTIVYAAIRPYKYPEDPVFIPLGLTDIEYIEITKREPDKE